MNKRDFIDALSQEMGLPKAEVRVFVSNFIHVAVEELSKEEGEILFQGFGVFSVWDQTERPGRNPRTGEPCTIRARKSIKFKASRFLIKGLNSKS